jgi:hypothetical protein
MSGIAPGESPVLGQLDPRIRGTGRRVLAYWLAIPADPKVGLQPMATELMAADTNITCYSAVKVHSGSGLLILATSRTG